MIVIRIGNHWKRHSWMCWEIDFQAFSMTGEMVRKGRTGGNSEKPGVTKQPCDALDTEQEDKE